MVIRFSKKLQAELIKIKDPYECLEKLKEIYLSGTRIEDCARLFNNTVQEIKDVLINWNIFEHKMCSKCKVVRPFSTFYTNYSMGLKTNKNGISSMCRICTSENGKNYFQNNREHKRKVDRENKRKPHIRQGRIEYQKKYAENPENRKKIAKRANDRYHNSIEQKLHTIVSVYINKCLIHGKESTSITEILDYTIEDLRFHLESQFDENMTWKNYGAYWEIDHFVGIANFRFTSYNDKAFKDCWSLQNLRPFEKSLNRTKKDEISEHWGNIELAAQFGITIKNHG
jgi:hypothetical protein